MHPPVPGPSDLCSGGADGVSGKAASNRLARECLNGHASVPSILGFRDPPKTPREPASEINEFRIWHILEPLHQNTALFHPSLCQDLVCGRP